MRAKTINNIKYLCAVALLISMALLALTVSCFAFTGCISKDVKQNQQIEVTDGNGNVLDSDKVHALPSAMVFATTTADSQSAGITVNATVEPTTAMDKSVDWSVSWVTPSTGWATGKSVNSYVAVTPTSDGSTTATVKCLAPFGAQIKVTVTSRVNKNATKSATLEYIKRIESVAITANYSGKTFNETPITWTLSEGKSVFDLPAEIKRDTSKAVNNYSVDWATSISYTYGTGTITPSVTTRFTIKYCNELKNAIIAQGLKNQPDWSICLLSPSMLISALIPNTQAGLEDGNTWFGASSTYAQLYSALQTSQGNIGELKFVATYDNNLTYEKIYNISFSPSSLDLVAKSISLSSSIIKL